MTDYGLRIGGSTNDEVLSTGTARLFVIGGGAMYSSYSPFAKFRRLHFRSPQCGALKMIQEARKAKASK